MPKAESIRVPVRATGPLLFLIFLDLCGFGMVLADIQLRLEHVGLTGWQIGAVLSSMFVVQVVASPLWGKASDQLGPKRVVLICTLLSALSMLIYGAGHSSAWVLASRIIAGFAAANVAIAQSWIASDFSESRRTVAMGKVAAAVSLGLIAGPALGGALSHWGGSRLVGFAAAAASLLGVLAVGLASSDRISERGSREVSLGSVDLQVRQPWALLSLAGVAYLSLACLEGTFARLLEHQWGRDQLWFGIVFAFESGIALVVQLGLLGRLSSTFSNRRLVQGALLLQGVGLASMPFFPVFGWVFVGAGVYSFGSAVFGPALSAWIADVTRAEFRGAAFGVLQSARSAGFIIGPLLGGALFDFRHFAPYVLAGFVCIAASAFAGFLRT